MRQKGRGNKCSNYVDLIKMMNSSEVSLHSSCLSKYCVGSTSLELVVLYTFYLNIFVIFVLR